MKFVSRVLFILSLSTTLHAAEYEFSTETFQLGRWSPSSLTYAQGLNKIEALDRWFQGLSGKDRPAFKQSYILNRNRLFLVTQEKRLRSELDQPVSVSEAIKDQIQPSWIAASRNIINDERKAMYKELLEINKSSLDNEKLLSKDLIRSLGAISKAGIRSAQSFDSPSAISRPVSKMSNASMQGYFPNGSSSLLNCKPHDEECLNRLSKLTGLPMTSFNDEIEKLLEPRVGTPICNAVNTHQGKGSDSFQKKKAAFLKSVGSENWVPSKSQNDLSRWYSPPTSQWTNGEVNAKCVGHAISSDIGALMNRGSMISSSVSADSTYAQIQVITKEELERKRLQGSITPDDQALLEELKDVPSIDSKHASFCNSSFYKVDEHLGSQKIDNSLTYIFNAFKSRPLCGSTTLPFSKEAQVTPKFTVDKFEAMEFQSPKEQALDFDFFRRLIDTGNPPIIAIDTDKREESGEWLHLKNGGLMQHVMNVVGYGEEIDPTTFCKVRYLKVRDSLGQKNIHYKVPIDDIVDHAIGVYKVTSVKQTN